MEQQHQPNLGAFFFFLEMQSLRPHAGLAKPEAAFQPEC